MKELKDYVRTIPDFPEPGIMFRDITTVLQDADGFALAVDSMADMLKDLEFDAFALAEARGFVLGSALAYKLKKPVILIRKKGKLPFETVSEEYDLEYGKAELEMHTDSIEKGQKIVLVDDLIATGGTLKAACNLVEKLGGEVVSVSALIELCGLNGRKALEGYRVDTVLKYEGK